MNERLEVVEVRPDSSYVVTLKVPVMIAFDMTDSWEKRFVTGVGLTLSDDPYFYHSREEAEEAAKLYDKVMLDVT